MRVTASFNLAALAAFALQPVPALAGPAPPAQAQWVLDQSGYYCALGAKLQGDPPATLVLRSLPGSGVYDLSLVGDSWPARILSAHDKAGVALSPGGLVEARSPDTVVEDGGHMLYIDGVSGAFLTGFGKSSGVALSVDGRKVLTYALPPSADAAMNALDGCISGKLIDAGADPAGFEAGSTWAKPIGDRRKWIDLPPMESIGNQNFHAAVRLDISAAGTPTGCGVLEVKGLDRDALCKALMQRARYQPARDPKGTPVKTVVVYVYDGAVRTVMTIAE